MTKNWAAYLNRLMGGRSQAEFARLLEVTDGQLSKWRNATSGHKVETVIEIARKLGDSPLHALVEVGYLNPSDVEQFKVAKPYGLDEYSDLELSQEIVRRVVAGTASAVLTEPVELEDDGTIVRPVRTNYDLVANDSIEEHPGDTDADYDNA